MFQRIGRTTRRLFGMLTRTLPDTSLEIERRTATLDEYGRMVDVATDVRTVQAVISTPAVRQVKAEDGTRTAFDLVADVDVDTDVEPGSDRVFYLGLPHSIVKTKIVGPGASLRLYCKQIT